jgi:hypothetical protein
MTFCGVKKTVLKVYQDCITVVAANSRLAFMIGTLTCAACLIFLTVAFVCVKDRTNFPSMVAAITGGGTLSAFGRFLTKKGDASPNDPDAPASDTVTPPVPTS